MGEVYRADDMKLGQQVALKFLPSGAARDLSLLELLHDEVRLGRQVSHPNVCRVYDIGESDGAPYVAMEYVDGEDLARLLQRIGRLSHDKAVEIARGIAAGVAAAHAKGILHRDLKPANVMIDGRGEPRITDFGLALASSESFDSNVISGTPAYMAPEQLEGKAATVQSDVYALGLVLYEIFTGRRARTGRTVGDLSREHATPVTHPSSVVRDIEPSVEQIILRCLERDPALRPRSAREVYDAFPGGDALAAALAAGETPSPRVVAASGLGGTITPAAAWAWMTVTLLLLAFVLAVNSEWRIMSRVPFEKPPAVLERDALEIGRSLGIPPARYRLTTLGADDRYLAWRGETDRSPLRLQHIHDGPPAVVFSMRQSPRPLTPLSDIPAANADDPPLGAGMSLVDVDTSGRLVALTAWPQSGLRGRADWTSLLRAAGLDARALRPSAPRQWPPVAFDERMAWDGVWPNERSISIHIEAAAASGRPVFFRIDGPWSGSDAVHRQPFSTPAMFAFMTAMLLAITAVALLLAWRNMRGRRGDRSGALRVAGAVFLIEIVQSLLLGDHRAVIGHELSLIVGCARMALFMAAAFFVLYMALEPYLRRHWPERLIGWSRLVAGNVRDPLVGRDLLIGLAAGSAHVAFAVLGNWLPGRIGVRPPPLPHATNLNYLLSVRGMTAAVIGAVEAGVMAGLLLTTLLVTLAILLRRRNLAVIALFAVELIAFAFAAGRDPYVFASAVLVAVVWTIVIVRGGLLAISVTQAVFLITFKLPMSVDASAWYFPPAVVPVVFMVGAAAYACRIATAGQPLFTARLLDD
jgi:serine/threonine-protein kinase